MPAFKYIVKDREGKTITGVADARDRENLIELLRKQDFTIISIEKERWLGARRERIAKKVNLDDLVIFSRQLSTMVEAGIPLVSVLDVLSQQIENKGFAAVITRVRDDVETGSSLSAAFSKHPRIFSTLYINMVKAGESSGMLDDILNRIATYLEKTASLQRKIKSAMVYPTAVIIVATAITVFLLVKVVPTFKGIFDMLGGELPIPTKILLAFSEFLRHWFLYGLGGLVVFVVVLLRYIKTERGRFLYDSVKLKLPLFGELIRKVSISKFSRTLSTLVKSGVPILTSLEIVARSVGNKVLEDAVNVSRKSVRDGKNIAEPLSKSRVFPPMVVRMIAVGEQAGELEKMLTKIADFYEEQVDAAVSGLTSVIEPVIIIFLGIIIGGIVLAIFLPIFKITQLLGR